MTGTTVGFDSTDERLARIAWSRLADPGDPQAQALVAGQGAAPALADVLAGGGTRRWQSHLTSLDPVADLRAVQRLGGRLLIPGDDEWPAPLHTLGIRAPFCLWVRGSVNVARATVRAAAVVGARAATSYGLSVAQDLGTGLAEAGVAVIAGAAYGIDGAAHRAVLAADGSTIAVLAGGVDRSYPRGHLHLLDRIHSVGAVVSENPPGSAPTRSRFIARRRLIAALAPVTVVVEAAHRSSAIATAVEAARLSRPVAVVPGPITSAQSHGCHQLLRQGAICVTSATDVSDLIKRP